MDGSMWCAANYVPLTPLSFLERAAVVYGDRAAVVCGDRRFSWRETRERCLAGAAALARLGVGRRDVVAVIASNVPAMYELHFSVPMTGAVLCTLNTRHDAAMVSVLLKHSEAKVFLVESQFHAVARDALRLLADAKDRLPLVITVSDPSSSSSTGDGRGSNDGSVAVAEYEPLPRRVRISTGGAPPPPQVLAKMDELGFDVAHGYGLTETYGPATTCVWKPEWDALPPAERARMKALQGVAHAMVQEVAIKDPASMETLPSDGRAVGEVMLRGNTVMGGYYKDAGATEEAMRGGWLRTGDLGVRHPNGYIQLKDRSKDIIISGGENISSIEVESVLFGHPAVLDAAVVARPDDHWGEAPCAFVTLRDGARATADDIIRFCRARLPHYMAPRTVVFSDLPKTSTGKTQKYLLREKARAMGGLRKPDRSRL
uniref:Uncharacterized protein n=1 Tax=Zea mays TaxID=4577 RepID=A0A804LD43_MAIZE